jgi:hypothetical protein
MVSVKHSYRPEDQVCDHTICASMSTPVFSVSLYIPVERVTDYRATAESEAFYGDVPIRMFYLNRILRIEPP